MRKLTLVLSTAALAVSGTAFAQTAPAPRAPKPDQTRAEAQARAEAMFARMDANRDGTINETDRAAMKAQRFDRLDTDRNGSISQTELAARAGDRAGKRRMARPEGAPAMTDAQKAERRTEMFARIDTDKNGALSRAEFDAMHAARSARGGKRAGAGAGMMAGPEHVGPGGRRGKAMAGPVSRQVFIDGALARFDKADANRDGTVTQAERKAARDTMRQQWQAKRQQQG